MDICKQKIQRIDNGKFLRLSYPQSAQTTGGDSPKPESDYQGNDQILAQAEGAENVRSVESTQPPTPHMGEVGKGIEQNGG